MTIETMRLLRVPQGLLLLLLGCHCDKVVAVALRSDAWPTCIQGTCQTAAAAPLILKSRRPALATRSPLFSSRRSDDFDGGEKQRQSPQPRPFATEAPPTTQQATDVPTQTVAEIIGVPSLPAKPKIVVLGATGGVGRHVVRQLLSTNVDMTVVAFCRNYDKALETLYEGAGDTDDDDQGGASGRSLVQRKSKRGPTLELVVGDLVDRSKVFNYKDEEDEIEVEFNSTTLASVRRFYGDSAADEVYKASSKKNDGETTDAHEALKMAIKDCTAIISCVGTVRPTNPWTDYVMNPLRIFRRASKWCSDPRHPYYVNYQSTREALALAEAEQARRDIEIEKFEQAEEEMAKEAAKMGRSYVPANGRSHKKKGPVERIKFVRISDLAVSIRPWMVVSLFTNIGRSLVFRDQEKCEIILENSKLIDTVTLRPGDLIDQPRNANTTNIQMDASGVLPYPAYVCKEDVAAVAVAAALTRKDGFTAAAKEDRYYEEDVGGKNVKKRRRKDAYESRGGAPGKDKATSYTWAVRWCGQDLEGQGRKSDGLPDAQSCVDRMLRLENKMEAKRKKADNRDGDSMQRVISQMTGPLKRRRLKPYGVAVAIPVYAVMAAIFFSALRNVPGKEIVLKYVVKRLSGA